MIRIRNLQFTIAIALGAALATSARADDAAKAKTSTVKVPDGVDIEITTPEGWSFDKAQPDPSIPPTITLYSPNKEACVKITLLPDKQGAFNTKEKIERIVENTAKAQYVGGSVEKKVTLQDLGSADGKGVIAEFTDASLVEKKAKAGEYKVACTGVLAMGNTVAAITVVGDAFDDKWYVAGKNVLKTGVKPHK